MKFQNSLKSQKPRTDVPKSSLFYLLFLFHYFVYMREAFPENFSFILQFSPTLWLFKVLEYQFSQVQVSVNQQQSTADISSFPALKYLIISYAEMLLLQSCFATSLVVKTEKTQKLKQKNVKICLVGFSRSIIFYLIFYNFVVKRLGFEVFNGSNCSYEKCPSSSAANKGWCR